MKSNLTDDLRILRGGVKAENIYVLISKDGSTVVRDPGLGRPWSTTNRKLAEDHAKRIGRDCVVTDLVTAIKSVTQHPKNLPKGLKGFKLPEM
jgi:hypothetical protein